MVRRPGFPWLMLVVDLDRALPWERILVAAWAGGVNLVQVRFRKTPVGRALPRIESLRALVPRDVPFLVNTRGDVARAVGADGVHLPEEDLPTDVARRLFPGLWIGRSIHGSPPEGELPDYWIFGHVFPTATHPDMPPRGLEALQAVASGTPVPVLAIGGITPENAGAVIRAGGAGVAVISAIAHSEDPCQAARALMEAMRQEASP